MTVEVLQKKYLPEIELGDFFVLLAHVTKKDKTFLLAHPEYSLKEAEEKQMQVLLERRLKREPVAYLTSHKEFYGRVFSVTKDTLVPRPETELMIDEILRYVEDTLFTTKQSLDVLDIGTGSGNIIVTLAKEIQREYTHYFALDISRAALDIAKKNAEAHDVQTSITFLESDLITAYIPHMKKNTYLIVAANLPYLSKKIYEAAESDVKDFEPKSALLSNQEGLEHYFRLLNELKKYQEYFSGGALFLEISPEQSSRLSLYIKELFPQARLSILLDLSGRERLVKAII